MSLLRIILGVLALAALAAAGAGASGAAFTSGSQNPANSVSSAADWTAPTVTLDDPGSPIRGTVALTASADDERSSVTSVSFQRRPAGGGQWTEIGSDSSAPWAMGWNTTVLADGSYDLRAVATDSAANTGTSAVIAARLVDNTAPTATLTDPGSPLSGTVALQVSAADSGSGVSRIAVQYSPAGQGSWTEIGSDTQPPYEVSWDTTLLADGAYDLRATVLDAAGNPGSSATVTNRQVANNSITLADPGAYLRGTVTFNATASASGGVQKVEFQGRAAGATTWTTFGTDTGSPYAAAYNTTTAPDGSYEMRALMTTNGGSTLGSNEISRVVDNTAPTGTNVQGTPKSGGTAGRLESGDAVSLTWSEKIDPATLFTGWNGTAAQTVYARLVDGSTKGTGSSQDWLEFFRNSGATQTTGFGAINLGGDFISSGSTTTFTSSVTLNAAGTTATITLGSASGSGLRTVAGNTTLRWTPSAAAKDLAGNATSTSQVTESGSADRDF